MKNNKESNYRYKNSWIDYMEDGMSDYERIKGKDKKYLRKKSQRKVRSENMRMEILNAEAINEDYDEVERYYESLFEKEN